MSGAFSLMSSEAQVRNATATTMAQDQDLDDRILREILCSVEENARVSQRQLSRELGIALGSVNWYLKRCINKGLIKISQVPLKRYMYFLTPQGMDEKGRLMGQYLKWSLDFFRLGREEASKILAECAATGRQRIVLAGNSDFAEIFIMSAIDYPVAIQSIFDIGRKDGKRLRTPVTGVLPGGEQTVYIITEITRPQAVWDELRAHGVAVDDIIIPRLLNFRPQTESA